MLVNLRHTKKQSEVWILQLGNLGLGGTSMESESTALKIDLFIETNT
jgi:hypothetical protein